MFTYRAVPGCCCGRAGIAVATVVGHVLKVARANPIHALRDE